MRLKQQSIKSRYTTGVMWTAIAAVLAQGSTYVCSIICARLLGRETFGQFAAIQSTVLACTSVSTLGLSVTAMKYVSEYRTTDVDKIGRILGLCFIVTVLTGSVLTFGVMLGSNELATHIFKSSVLAPGLKVASLYILFYSMNAYQIGTLMGLEAFKSLAIASLLQSLSATVLTLLFTWRFGLFGASLALATSAASSWLIYQIILRRACRMFSIREQFIGAWEERKLLYGFALPAVMSGVMGSGVMWTSNAILVRQASGFAEMAMYNAANMLRNLVLYLPGMGAKVASPMLCNLRSEKDDGIYSSVFWVNFKICAVLSVLTATLLAVFAPYLLKLFGKEFTGGKLVCVLLLISGVVEALAVSLYQAVFSYGKMWWQAGVVAVWAGVWLVVSTLLIPRYGAIGLACAPLIAWPISLFLYFMMSRKLFRSNKNPKIADKVYETNAL